MEIRPDIAEAATSLVSVVLPTYKQDNLQWLREALDSILGQTYSYLECIVVLDGEVTPETRAFLDETARRDARVRLLVLPANAGQASARNAGIGAARGEYIAMLDSDDIAMPERIEKQIAFLKAAGADLVGSCYSLINADGVEIGRKLVPLGHNGIRRWLFLFNPLANSTVLAKAAVFKRHPYHQRSSDSMGVFGEDYALWVTLARKGYQLRNQPECLVNFRMYPGFIGKRRGWLPFRTDIATKLSAVPLYTPILWPLVALAAVATSATRLMPQTILAALYRLRSKVRFRS